MQTIAKYKERQVLRKRFRDMPFDRNSRYGGRVVVRGLLTTGDPCRVRFGLILKLEAEMCSRIPWEYRDQVIFTERRDNYEEERRNRVVHVFSWSYDGRKRSWFYRDRDSN